MKAPHHSHRAQRTEDLKPWMRGPFELIRHADGHLKLNDDTDRRIALIGFDNAVEVSIDVFIRLHPIMRGGLQLPRVEVENAQRNYHTKIEFLDNHVQARQIPLSIQVDEIVWYHQLRNELYHSGNGMVPEQHVIAGARTAALAVFHALFGVDVSPLLGDERLKSIELPPVRTQIQSQNPEMEFLGWFIELEQAVRNAQPKDAAQATSLRKMWQSLLERRADLRDLDSDFADLLVTRNSIVHGQLSFKGNEEKLNDRMGTILRLLERLERRPS